MNWILNGLVRWIADKIVEFLETFSGLFLRVFSVDLDLFTAYFPIVQTAYEIFQTVAYALILLTVVWQLLRTMLGPVTETAEEPWVLLVRGAVFGLGVTYAYEIFQIVLNIVQAPYKWLSDLDASAGSWTDISQVFADEITQSGAGKIIIDIIWLILLISLAVNYFKLLLEIVERYVVLGVLAYTSPMAFALGTTKATGAVFRSWCRMVGSHLFLMLMNIWFLKAVDASMAYLVTGGASEAGGNALFWEFCVIGILKTAQRLDTYLAALGLNTAQTGGGLGAEILLAGRCAMRNVATATRTLGSMLGGGFGRWGGDTPGPFSGGGPVDPGRTTTFGGRLGSEPSAGGTAGSLLIGDPEFMGNQSGASAGGTSASSGETLGKDGQSQTAGAAAAGAAAAAGETLQADSAPTFARGDSDSTVPDAGTAGEAAAQPEGETLSMEADPLTCAETAGGEPWQSGETLTESGDPSEGVPFSESEEFPAEETLSAGEVLTEFSENVVLPGADPTRAESSEADSTDSGSGSSTQGDNRISASSEELTAGEVLTGPSEDAVLPSADPVRAAQSAADPNGSASGFSTPKADLGSAAGEELTAGEVLTGPPEGVVPAGATSSRETHSTADSIGSEPSAQGADPASAAGEVLTGPSEGVVPAAAAPNRGTYAPADPTDSGSGTPNRGTGPACAAGEEPTAGETLTASGGETSPAPFGPVTQEAQMAAGQAGRAPSGERLHAQTRPERQSVGPDSIPDSGTQQTVLRGEAMPSTPVSGNTDSIGTAAGASTAGAAVSSGRAGTAGTASAPSGGPAYGSPIGSETAAGPAGDSEPVRTYQGMFWGTTWSPDPVPDSQPPRSVPPNPDTLGIRRQANPPAQKTQAAGETPGKPDRNAQPGTGKKGSPARRK